MGNPAPANILFSSRYKYYLNYATTSGTLSIPATSYTAGTAQSYSISIPLTRTDDFTNIKINFSHLSSNWYSFRPTDVILDANFTITTVGSYSSNNLTLTFYVVNQTASTHTNTAITVTVQVAKFVTPS